MKGNCISSWNEGRDVKTKSTCKLFFFQKSLPPPKRFYGGSTHSAAKRAPEFKLVNENLKPPPKKKSLATYFETHIRWIRILKTYNMVLWWENVCANCKWISCQRATRLPRINEIVMFTVHEPKPLEHIHRSIWHQDIGRIGCYEYVGLLKASPHVCTPMDVPVRHHEMDPSFDPRCRGLHMSQKGRDRRRWWKSLLKSAWICLRSWVILRDLEYCCASSFRIDFGRKVLWC